MKNIPVELMDRKDNTRMNDTWNKSHPRIKNIQVDAEKFSTQPREGVTTFFVTL